MGSYDLRDDLVKTSRAGQHVGGGYAKENAEGLYSGISGGIGEQAMMEGGLRQAIAHVSAGMREVEMRIRRAGDELFGASPQPAETGSLSAVQSSPSIEVLLQRLADQADRLVGESSRLNRIG